MIEYNDIHLNLISNKSKVAGVNQTLQKIEDNLIDCVFLAFDAETDFKEKIKHKCRQKNIKIINIFSCGELAALCKIDVPCAVCGILKDR